MKRKNNMASLQGFAQLKSGTYFHEMTEYYSKQYVAQARKDHPELSKMFQNDSDFMLQPGVQENLKKDPSAPVWLGGIASHLGIKDNIVDLDRFQQACSGYDPTCDLTKNPIKLADTAYELENGKPVIPENNKDARRVGFEQIIGMSTEFSALRAISDREDQKRLDEMVNIAMKRMFKEMEKVATARVNGKEVPVDGLLAVPYFHFENRGAKDKKPQPFSHVHFIVMNTCMKDGKYYALNSESIAKHKAYLNQVFSTELTNLMRQEGYEMVAKYNKSDSKSSFINDGLKGVFTMVPKVPERLVRLFSERKIDMENNVMAARAEKSDDATFIHDDPSVREMELAQVKTKNQKSKEGILEQDIRWKEEALKEDPMFNSAFAKSLKTGKQRNLTEQDLREAIKKVCAENKISIKEFENNLLDAVDRHTKKIANSEDNIKNFLTQYFIQFTDKDTAIRASTTFFEKNYIAAFDEKTMKLYQDLKNPNLTTDERISIEGILNRNLVYANRDFVQREEQMVKDFSSKFNDKSYMLNKKDVLTYIKTKNAEMKKQAKKDYDNELKKQTPQYLASLNEEDRKKAIDKLAKLKDNYENAGYRTEQVNSIIKSTTEKGGLILISGAAGTGKSHQARCVIELYKGMRADGKKGKEYTVYALGSSQSNTKNLADSVGIDRKDAFNASKFLTEVKLGNIKLDSKSVICADEFSMLASNEWQEFGKLVANTGCKVIAMGDSKQCASIGSSDGFGVLSKLFTTATLKEVSRQDLSWQCAATVEFLNGKGDNALIEYAKQGRVDMSAIDNKEAVELAVKGFISDFERIEKENSLIEDKSKHQNPFSECLILASQNSICTMANDKVREYLKEKGVLKGTAVQIKNNDGEVKEIQAGDRIMFLGTGTGGATVNFDKNGMNINNLKINKAQKDKAKAEGFGISNGEEAVVISINPERKTFSVKMSSGETREIQANQRLQFQHSYAWSIHKSQGQTKNKTQCIVDNTNMIDANLLYVMLSRQKKDINIILPQSLKGDQIYDGPALPEHTARVLDVIKEQNITFKSNEVNPSGWQYYKTIQFLKQHDPDFVNRNAGSEIMDFTDLLEAARTCTDKKTSWDYQYIDKRAATEDRNRIERKLNGDNPVKTEFKDMAAVKNGGIVVKAKAFIKEIFKPYQWQQVKPITNQAKPITNQVKPITNQVKPYGSKPTKNKHFDKPLTMDQKAKKQLQKSGYIQETSHEQELSL